MRFWQKFFKKKKFHISVPHTKSISQALFPSIWHFSPFFNNSKLVETRNLMEEKSRIIFLKKPIKPFYHRMTTDWLKKWIDLDVIDSNVLLYYLHIGLEGNIKNKKWKYYSQLICSLHMYLKKFKNHYFICIWTY